MKKSIAVVMSLLMLVGVVAPGLGVIGASAADTTYTIVEDSAVADPSTKNISSEFKNSMGQYTSENNGKILGDKSVEHMSEDIFNTTLSALGQAYPITSQSTVEYKTHADVVFVIDVSSSMINENMVLGDGSTSTVKRSEGTCMAVNAAINMLYYADPETRFGIVNFGNCYYQDQLTIPIDKYTLPEGDTNYLLYGKDAATTTLAVPNEDPIAEGKAPYQSFTYIYLDGTAATQENNASKARFYVDFDGNVQYYPANSTEPTGEFTVADKSYQVYSVGSTNYTILRVGSKYSIYKDVAFTTSTRNVTVPHTQTISSISTASSNKTSFTLENGRTFYVYRSTSGNYQNLTYTFNIYTSRNATNTVATVSSSSTSSTFTNNSVSYTLNYIGNSSFSISYNTTETETVYNFTNSKNITVATTTSGTAQRLETSGLLVNSKGQQMASSGFTFKTGTNGTYTQAGLIAAQKLFAQVEDTSKRVPVVILVSDGCPTYYDNDWENVPWYVQTTSSSNTGGNGDTGRGGTGSKGTSQMGYLTIRTAMSVKNKVGNMYPDQDALFYSLGPGVGDLYGQTVLDPCKENLDKCEGNTTDKPADTPATPDELRTLLLTNLSQEELEYVDYANMSASGDMTAAELTDIFRDIIQNITDVPRPVSKIVLYDETNTQIFNGRNMTMTDKIGDGMTLECVDTETGDVDVSKAPVLTVYETDSNGGFVAKEFHASLAFEFVGTGTDILKKYSIAYSGEYVEASTGIEKDISNMAVTVTTYIDGTQRVDWAIPSDQVPVIYPDIANEGVFYGAEPVRLSYKVKLFAEESGTYYTNNTEDIASCAFAPALGNPYYYDAEKNEDNIVYTFKNELSQDTKVKASNPTGTAANAWEFSTITASTTQGVTEETQEYGVVIQTLGNNGKISILGGEINPVSVVIDYGLPVSINTVSNNGIPGTITALSTALVGGTILNDEAYEESRLAGSSVTKSGNVLTLPHGTATFNDTHVTYTPTDMKISSEQVFYYELTSTTGFKYYSTITVIPATTIYYEDSFVSFQGDWSTEGTLISDAFQHEDHPGEDGTSGFGYEKANNYGYDDQYLNCDTYSLGQSHKSTVSSKNKNSTGATCAEFTFTGTAFDIISVTSGTTGTINCIVTDDGGNVVKDAAGKNADWVVDTYYGYKYEEDKIVKNTWKYENETWKRTEQVCVDEVGTDGVVKLPADPAEGDTAILYTKSWTTIDKGALYQIPVLKSTELNYGTYNVKVYPAYARFFDHTGNGQYDFYMDAVRVYSPADLSNLSDVIADAYNSDKENVPVYLEIKNVITAGEYTDDSSTGVLFLDGYTNSTLGDGTETYKVLGPNNEVYLQPKQSIAFMISDENGANVTSVQVAARIFEEIGSGTEEGGGGTEEGGGGTEEGGGGTEEGGGGTEEGGGSTPTVTTVITRTPITLTDGTALYVENLSGVFSIYTQETEGTALATVSASSTAASFSVNSKTYDLAYKSATGISITEQSSGSGGTGSSYTADSISTSSTSKTPLPIGSVTFYALRFTRANDTRVYIYENADDYASNYLSDDLRLDAGASVDYTYNNVTYTFSRSSDGNSVTVSTGSGGGTTPTPQNFTIEESSHTIVESDRTELTLEDGTKFYAYNSAGTFYLYAQEADETPVATVSESAASATFTVNSTEYELVRTDATSITIQDKTEIAGETRSYTSDALSTSSTSRTQITLDSYTIYAYRGTKTNSGTAYLCRTTSDSSFATLTTGNTYTDTVNGITYTLTFTGSTYSNRKITVSYTTESESHDPEAFTVEDSNPSGPDDPVDPDPIVTDGDRAKVTLEDGTILYISNIEGSFEVYTVETDGTAIAAVDETNTSANFTVGDSNYQIIRNGRENITIKKMSVPDETRTYTESTISTDNANRTVITLDDYTIYVYKYSRYSSNTVRIYRSATSTTAIASLNQGGTYDDTVNGITYHISRASDGDAITVTYVKSGAGSSEDFEIEAKEQEYTERTGLLTATTAKGSIIHPVKTNNCQTATDLYYDISNIVTFNNGQSCVILLTSTGNATISITNIKITHSPSLAPLTQAAPRLMMSKAAALTAIEYANNNYMQSILPHTNDTTEPEEPTPTEPTPDEPTEFEIPVLIYDSSLIKEEAVPDEPAPDEPAEENDFFAAIKQFINKIIEFFKWLFQVISNFFNPVV